MTATTRQNKSYIQRFKEEAAALVAEQGYSVTDAASACVYHDAIGF
jgi:transposase-like protein